MVDDGLEARLARGGSRAGQGRRRPRLCAATAGRVGAGRRRGSTPQRGHQGPSVPWKLRKGSLPCQSSRTSSRRPGFLRAPGGRFRHFVRRDGTPAPVYSEHVGCVEREARNASFKSTHTHARAKGGTSGCRSRCAEAHPTSEKAQALNFEPRSTRRSCRARRVSIRHPSHNPARHPARYGCTSRARPPWPCRAASPSGHAGERIPPRSTRHRSGAARRRW